MEKQDYNLDNLDDTFYLFRKDNEHMINSIKKFALSCRTKVSTYLNLNEKQAGFMQQIINNKIWADKTYTYNKWKNKNMPNNFLGYFLSWDLLESNLKYETKLTAESNLRYKTKLTEAFLESQNLIADDLEQYFIINKTQLKSMLGGKGLVGAIKKEMAEPPLEINIFNLKDQFATKKITEEQYKYYGKMEQNIFSLIAHEELFKTIINHRIAIACETQFFTMKASVIKNLKKELKLSTANNLGNYNGFNKNIWKDNKILK